MATMLSGISVWADYALSNASPLGQVAALAVAHRRLGSTGSSTIPGHVTAPMDDFTVLSGSSNHNPF